MAHPLILLRSAKGLSHPEYARLVARTHVELGLGQMAARREKVSRWESGRTVPEHTAQLAMAHIHGVAAREVRRLGWPHWLHLVIGDTTLLEQPYTAAGAELALSSALHLPKAPRSPRLLLRGPALTAQLRSALTQIAADGGGTRAGRDARPGRGDVPGRSQALAEQLHWIEARTGALERHEDGSLIPAEALYRAAHAEHRLVVGLFNGRDRDDPAARPLFRLAARTALLCTWLSSAVGEETRAERHNLTAIRAAAAAAAPGTASAAMAHLARRHLTAGSPADALALVRAAAAVRAGQSGQSGQSGQPGQSGQRGSSYGPESILHCAEALALARLGNATGAARALDRAAASAASGGAGPAVGAGAGAGAGAERCVTVSRALAALFLGDPQGAKPYFELFTDSLLAPRSAVPSPQTGVWLLYAADAHLALGELDRVADTVHRAVDVTGRLPPGLDLQYRARLARHENEPAVRQVLERLDEGSRSNRPIP
ncbi:hypothetical protein ACFY2K_14290 [Kitasatospora sp. NPDC001309]|uniref:hypothetical protein n=1 Tax=Kitasatospora sp. NPDC001309 TaxID=3364013 RepID=UPI0036741EEF